MSPRSVWWWLVMMENEFRRLAFFFIFLAWFAITSFLGTFFLVLGRACLSRLSSLVEDICRLSFEVHFKV